MLIHYINTLSRRSSGVFHFIFFGESNSGGSADNFEALASELDEDPNIKIWNNTSNDGVLNLKISNPGSNNLLGHDGKDPSQVGVRHGWELQLQNIFADRSDVPVQLTKCGQGGSVIAEWGVSDSYYTTLVSRVTNHKSYLASNNIDVKGTFAWMSFGINDSIAGTNPNSWYTDTVDFIARVKAVTGASRVIMTRIPRNNANYEAIDNKIVEIGQNISYVTVIEVSDAPKRDTNHWSYAGMKILCNRMWEASIAP